jgi:hypothetical protein
LKRGGFPRQVRKHCLRHLFRQMYIAVGPPQCGVIDQRKMLLYQGRKRRFRAIGRITTEEFDVFCHGFTSISTAGSQTEQRIHAMCFCAFCGLTFCRA